MLRRVAAAAAAVAPPSMTSLEPPQLRMRPRCLPRLSSANAALTLVSAMEWGAAAGALVVAGCNKNRSRLSRGHLDPPQRALPTQLPVCFPWFSLAAAEGATLSPEISTSCLCRVGQRQPTLDITSRKVWRQRRQLASPLRLSKRGQGMSTL